MERGRSARLSGWGRCCRERSRTYRRDANEKCIQKLVTTKTWSHSLWACKAIFRVAVLTRSVRLWWGHRSVSFLPGETKTGGCVIVRKINVLYHGFNKEKIIINSQCPHLSSRAGRSADISLGSVASSGLHQQIYTTEALTALESVVWENF